MRIQASLHWLIGLTVAVMLAPSTRAQDGADYATVNISEDAVGPNVGSPPRPPRRTQTDDAQVEAIEAGPTDSLRENWYVSVVYVGLRLSVKF